MTTESNQTSLAPVSACHALPKKATRMANETVTSMPISPARKERKAPRRNGLPA